MFSRATNTIFLFLSLRRFCNVSSFCGWTKVSSVGSDRGKCRKGLEGANSCSPWENADSSGTLGCIVCFPGGVIKLTSLQRIIALRHKIFLRFSNKHYLTIVQFFLFDTIKDIAPFRSRMLIKINITVMQQQKICCHSANGKSYCPV